MIPGPEIAMHVHPSPPPFRNDRGGEISLPPLSPLLPLIHTLNFRIPPLLSHPPLPSLHSFPCRPFLLVPFPPATFPSPLPCPYPNPQIQLRGLGIAVSAPSGFERSPAAKRFWCISRCNQRTFCHFHNVTFVILLYILALYNGNIINSCGGDLRASPIRLHNFLAVGAIGPIAPMESAPMCSPVP